MTTEPVEIHQSSSNLFADLGRPDAEIHLLKVRLTAFVLRLLDEQGLSQANAAQRFGLAETDLAQLLRGGPRDHTAFQLMKCLTALGQDLEIVVRPHPMAGEGGRITVTRVT